MASVFDELDPTDQQAPVSTSVFDKLDPSEIQPDVQQGLAFTEEKIVGRGAFLPVAITEDPEGEKGMALAVPGFATGSAQAAWPTPTRDP